MKKIYLYNSNLVTLVDDEDWTKYCLLIWWVKKGKDTIYLGLSSNKLDAAKLYNEAARYYFGEFAVLNQLGEIVNGTF